MTLEKGSRYCPLCSKNMPGGVNRHNVNDHLRRHFEPQLECKTCHMKFWAEVGATGLISYVRDSCPEGMPPQDETKVYAKGKTPLAADGLVGRGVLSNYQPGNLRNRIAVQQVSAASLAADTSYAQTAVDCQAFVDIDAALEKSSFGCSVCTHTTSSLADMREHMEVAHAIKIECGVCKATVAEKDWPEHSRRHRPSTAVCPGCQQEVSMTIFDQHKLFFCDATNSKIAGDPASKVLVCNACQAEFTSLSDLREHRVAHQESSMIMQYAKATGYPTHLVSSVFRASITPVISSASDEYGDNVDILLANLGREADAVKAHKPKAKTAKALAIKGMADTVIVAAEDSDLDPDSTVPIAGPSAATLGVGKAKRQGKLNFDGNLEPASMAPKAKRGSRKTVAATGPRQGQLDFKRVRRDTDVLSSAYETLALAEEDDEVL